MSRVPILVSRGLEKRDQVPSSLMIQQYRTVVVVVAAVAVVVGVVKIVDRI